MSPHNHGSTTMDMSDSDMSGMSDVPGTDMGSMDMKMYFHGSIGDDYFLFKTWIPTSAGAIVGVCVAVFILGIFERYLMAVRRACDSHWRRGQIGLALPHAGGTHHYMAPSDSRQSFPADHSSTPSSDSSSAGACCVLNAETDDLDAMETTEYSQLEKKLDPSTAHLPRAARLVEDPMRKQRWSRPFQWGVDLPRGLLQASQTLIHYILMLTVMTFQLWFIIAVVIGAGVGEVLFGRFGSGHTGCA